MRRGVPIIPGPATLTGVFHWLRRHLRLPHFRLRTPRWPLRHKVSIFFGLLALVASVSLSVVTYTFARSSLLDDRNAAAKGQAINNGRRVLEELRRGDTDEFGDWFTGTVNPEDDGFNLVQLNDGRLFADLRSPDAFPEQLRTTVAEHRSGLQRFTFNGDHYIGVGVYLAAVDAGYYEAFPLDSTERTLRSVLIAFSVGSGVTVLLASAIGIWTGRRLLRPLQRVTDVASEIAGGDLSTRVAPERDPDLQPLVNSFNDMADAVQTRIEREERFASDVSHELRSPITALAAATDVLERRRDELPERSKQAVDVVINQVRRFDGMVLDLLELARIDAGARDIHLEPADIAALCRRIATRFGYAELPIDVGPDVPPTVTIDRIRFERILGNLLDNAKNHAGGPKRIAIEASSDGHVDVVVEDAGPGVDEGERARIFERFARGQASLHRVGTGLGLALVAEHVHGLGGDVWVEDRPGGGSRFVVHLPTGPDDDDDEVEKS